MAKLADTITGARIVGEHVRRSRRSSDPEGRMPLGDHLRELRSRLLKAAAAIAVVMIVALVFFNPIWHFIVHPFCSAVILGQTGCHRFGDQLVVHGVFDAFFLHIKVALVAGLIVASPVWLYQLWAFIAPGLYAREKRWAYLFTASAVPLFVGGAMFAYLVMSRGLHYLLGLTPGGVANLPSVDTYLSYFVGMMLGFGLAFELPLAIVILNVAGILTHERFRKWRKMLIFGVVLFAGIASPSPDPITMIML